MKAREELLLKMYDQMFNDINRHILVTWQSVGVVLVALGSFSLLEKQLLPLSYIITFVLIISFWALYTFLDSSYWYNRNLVIIANIERQFLNKDDLKNIHYYFGKHRSKNAMLTHLKIQQILIFSIIVLLLIYHFINVLLPSLIKFVSTIHISHFDKLLPYLFLIILLTFYFHFRKNRNDSYAEFIKNSPGSQIDTTGIQYGIGHPAEK